MPTLCSTVEDQTGKLTSAEKARIESVLAQCAGKVGVEFDVLVVHQVPGRNFRDHAMAERKRMAAEGRNSILLVVALADRHVELATSPKYNNLFTKSVTHNLLLTSAVPLLREARLAQGILAAVEAAMELIANPSRGSTGGKGAIRKWIGALAGAALAMVLVGGTAGYQYYRLHTCRGCGTWGNYETHVVHEATPTEEGLKEHSFHCPRCQTNYVWETVISRVDTSSDSGFSGSDSGSSSSSSSSDGGGGADF